MCEQAGLGKLSKSTAAKIYQELRERYDAFTRPDLYDIQLVALFIDAVYLAVPPRRDPRRASCAPADPPTRARG